MDLWIVNKGRYGRLDYASFEHNPVGSDRNNDSLKIVLPFPLPVFLHTCAEPFDVDPDNGVETGIIGSLASIEHAADIGLLWAFAKGVGMLDEKPQELQGRGRPGAGLTLLKAHAGRIRLGKVDRPRTSVSGELQTNAWNISSVEAVPTQRLSQLEAIYAGAPVGLCFLGCHLRYVSLNETARGLAQRSAQRSRSSPCRAAPCSSHWSADRHPLSREEAFGWPALNVRKGISATGKGGEIIR